MKILGAIIYCLGFLILGYIITETRIDLGGSFGGILFIFVILFLTMGIGSTLWERVSESEVEQMLLEDE